MPDNVTTQSTTLATVPASTTIATDDVGGAHYQRVKLDVGADGAASAVVTNVPTKETRATTPSQTSVAGNVGNVTLLSANSNRLGATVFNDSTATLYLKLGTTASTSSFTVMMAPSGYYEVPFNYTGQIDGIWSSGTGNARITELT